MVDCIGESCIFQHPEHPKQNNFTIFIAWKSFDISIVLQVRNISLLLQQLKIG